MRTPESALRELIVYLEQTLPRRQANRDRRPAEVAAYAQVSRDLARIVEQVPPGLLERERRDPDTQRREINAVYAAAMECRNPLLVQELWALRERLVRELRGGDPKGAAPVPLSSAEFLGRGAPGSQGEG